MGAGAVPSPWGRAVCRAPVPSCRYLRELGRCLGSPAGQKCPFGAQRCRASAAGASFGALPQTPNRSGAGLAFLVALAIMLSVASTSSLYFLTPTCVFTSSSYLSELKGLFHEKKTSPAKRSFCCGLGDAEPGAGCLRFQPERGRSRRPPAPCWLRVPELRCRCGARPSRDSRTRVPKRKEDVFPQKGRGMHIPPSLPLWEWAVGDSWSAFQGSPVAAAQSWD